MKNLHVAALATLFGISATSGIALTQAQHPSNASGLFASTASIASADQDDRGNRKKHRNNNGNWQNAQCNTNSTTHRGNGDSDDQGNNQGNRGNGRGRGRNQSTPPQYCGNTNGNNCNNGRYNCNPNGGGNGQQGNSNLRGTIVSINGNQVRLMAGFGQFVTINDQQALNNQSTGRVAVGRYVTAYGYYQNGTFYATSLQ